MAENVKKTVSRDRVFATTIYLDSAPEFWMDILADLKIPCFISPCHDKDVWTKLDESKNPEHVAGMFKKPHYHVMLMYKGVKSREQVEKVWSAIGGVGFEDIHSPFGYARYLCHLDHKDKAQYDVNDVISICADYHAYIELSADKYSAVMEMIQFCKENEIYSYAELLEWSSIHRYDWFKSLCDNSSYVVREYLKSRYWDLKEAQYGEKG